MRWQLPSRMRIIFAVDGFTQRAQSIWPPKLHFLISASSAPLREMKLPVPTMFSFACRFGNEQLTRENDCKAIWPH